MNVTQSDSTLWPQVSSPDNINPLFVVPVSPSNVAGVGVHFHSAKSWTARAGYEWTGTHNPGCVTDARANNRLASDVTITPVRWLNIGTVASMILQRSWQPGFRRLSVGSGIRRFWTNGRLTGNFTGSKPGLILRVGLSEALLAIAGL